MTSEDHAASQLQKLQGERTGIIMRLLNAVGVVDRLVSSNRLMLNRSASDVASSMNAIQHDAKTRSSSVVGSGAVQENDGVARSPPSRPTKAKKRLDSITLTHDVSTGPQSHDGVGATLARSDSTVISVMEVVPVHSFAHDEESMHHRPSSAPKNQQQDGAAIKGGDTSGEAHSPTLTRLGSRRGQVFAWVQDEENGPTTSPKKANDKNEKQKDTQPFLDASSDSEVEHEADGGKEQEPPAAQKDTEEDEDIASVLRSPLPMQLLLAVEATARIHVQRQIQHQWRLLLDSLDLEWCQFVSWREIALKDDNTKKQGEADGSSAMTGLISRQSFAELASIIAIEERSMRCTIEREVLQSHERLVMRSIAVMRLLRTEEVSETKIEVEEREARRSLAIGFGARMTVLSARSSVSALVEPLVATNQPKDDIFKDVTSFIPETALDTAACGECTPTLVESHALSPSSMSAATAETNTAVSARPSTEVPTPPPHKKMNLILQRLQDAESEQRLLLIDREQSTLVYDRLASHFGWLVSCLKQTSSASRSSTNGTGAVSNAPLFDSAAFSAAAAQYEYQKQIIRMHNHLLCVLREGLPATSIFQREFLQRCDAEFAIACKDIVIEPRRPTLAERVNRFDRCIRNPHAPPNEVSYRSKFAKRSLIASDRQDVNEMKRTASSFS